MDYKVKEAKNGLKVPVVNDVHIHSIYDPEKEGEALLKQHAAVLEKKSNVLILGLGYGYHIWTIVEYFREQKRSFHVSAIEPNRQVMEGCISLGHIDLQEITIYCEQSVGQLFRSAKLIDFLLQKPAIIPHAPSFNLYREYFTEFLTYKNTEGLGEEIDTIEDEEAKDYFSGVKCQRPHSNSNFSFALSAFRNIQ